MGKSGDLTYCDGPGEKISAMRTVLFCPDWIPEQRMANFWPFNIQHLILNADKREVHCHKGEWSTALARGRAVTSPPHNTLHLLK